CGTTWNARKGPATGRPAANRVQRQGGNGAGRDRPRVGRNLTALRILVADDHEVVRRGVRVLLEAHPGWQICDEAVEGRDAVEKAGRLRPEVVILDIGMPLLNGLDAARQILKASPQSEVLILTMHESEQVIREVLASGARG